MYKYWVHTPFGQTLTGLVKQHTTMEATKTLVCLVVILAAASAVPLNIRDDFDKDSYGSVYQCARQCKANPTKFGYQTAKSYAYEYKAEAETSMVGASEDKAKMMIQAQVLIEVISQCEFALRLTEVKLYHSEPKSDSLKLAQKSQEFESSVAAYNLRFSYNDGVIQDICHSSEELNWVLNFKRGIISAFQNSMDDLTVDQMLKETDVSGECNVQYNTTSNWAWDNSVTIQKSKNLMSCSKRDGFRSFIPMVPYKVASDIQSLPIMKSSQECKQTISSTKQLEVVSCEENHIYAPFSNHQSGAATKVKQTLTFVNTLDRVLTYEDIIEARSSLVFRHVNGDPEYQSSMMLVQQKLTELCAQTEDSIRPETPRLFSELVQSVKSLSAADWRSLLKLVTKRKLCATNGKAKKFLLDTLPLAGTEGAIETMVRVISSDDISDLEKKVWLTSLSLTSEPTKEMLPSILKLLSGVYAEQSLLSASTFLNAFCKKDSSCDKTYLFRKIISQIIKNIDSTCSSGDSHKTMRALRAIGNIGYGEDFLPTLRMCLKSQDAPLEHKLAAADAYRKFRCQDNEETGPLAEIFEMQNADPELRMVSFMSLMRCPSESVLQKVVTVLDQETDSNVGGFIYSHLKGLMETSDPHKQDIAAAINGLKLKPFEGNGLKTSKCFESSVLLNRLNLGYVADADLIWPSPAVVPRAARVNLTMELFGNSINVFEAGAHVDGFEYFVQKYFGKQGYFAESKSGRDDLKAFFYARMFGNEFFFHDINGMKDLEDQMDMKSSLNLDTILENLSKDFNYKFSHTQQLIDGSFIIPTIIGMPINITVNSSVSVSAQAKGKIDLGGILSGSKNIIIDADIFASAALEATGSMLLDGHLYKQGLRMRSTLHSSIDFEPSIKVSRRQILDIQIGAPKQKQELIGASSQFFIIHDNVEKEQEMIKENRKELNYCTGDRFGDATGLEMCAEFQYPNASRKDDAPYLPFTGPMKASLVLNKKDTQRNYKIFAKWIQKSKKVEAQVILDTPGSKINRQISAEATYNGVSKGVKNVDVTLQSPWLKFVMNGEAKMAKDMSLTGSVVVDETKRYALKAEVKKTRKGKHHEYTPIVEIENLDRKISLLSGSVIHNENKDISSSLNMIDWNEKSYNLEGKIVFARWEKRIEVAFKQTAAKRPYKLELGVAVKKSGKDKSNTRVEQQLVVLTPRRTILRLNSKTEYQTSTLKGIATFNLQSMVMKRPVVFKAVVKPTGGKQRKQRNFDVRTKFSSQFGTAETTALISLAKLKQSVNVVLKYDIASLRDQITWSGKLKNEGNNKLIQYDMHSLLMFREMPAYNTEADLKISHKVSSSKSIRLLSTMSLNAKYGKNFQTKKTKQLIKVVATIKGEFKKNFTQAEIAGDFGAKIPEKNVDFDMNFSHNHVYKKRLESKMNLRLLPFVQNDIKTSLFLLKKGGSLSTMNVKTLVEANGKQYSVMSQLAQKTKKRYDHSLTAVFDKMTHKMVTVFKKSNSQYDITMNIVECPLLRKPVKARVTSIGKSLSNLQIEGELRDEKNNRLYSFTTSSKMDKWRIGKWRLVLGNSKPTVRAQASFNKDNVAMNTDATVHWDVDPKQKPSEIRFSAYFTPGSVEKSDPMKSKVDLSTPFKSLQRVFFTVEKSKNELRSRGRINMGGSNKQMTSELTAQLPISPEQIKVVFEATTPFKKYKQIDLEIDHSLALVSKLEGKLNRGESKLTLLGQSRLLDTTNFFEGEAQLRADHIIGKDIVLKTKLSTNENEMKTYLSAEQDGKKYAAVFDINGSETKKGSRVVLSAPNRETRSSLDYVIDNGKHDFTATLEHSKLDETNLAIKVDGAYIDLDHLQLNGKAEYGSGLSKEMNVEFFHERRDDGLENKIILSKGRAKTGYDVKLTNEPLSTSSEVVLFMSPMYENDVTLMATTEFSTYPMTGSAHISWAPGYNVYLGGSYNGETMDDREVNLKLTTPFENFENVVIGASSKLRESVRVSHLNIDYAVGKMIDIEMMSQNDKNKQGARIKISSPGVILHQLDCGIKSDATKGLYKVDYEVIVSPPEKYTGDLILRWKKENLQSRIVIRTPVEGYNKIECKLNHRGCETDTISSLTVMKDGVNVADITVQTTLTKEEVMFTTTTKGEWLRELAKHYDEALSNHFGFYPHFYKDNKENEIDQLVSSFKVKKSGKRSQLYGSLEMSYGKWKKLRSVDISTSGDEVNDMSVEMVLKVDHRISKGKFLVQLKDDIQFEAYWTGISEKRTGIILSHSEQQGKFETKVTFMWLDGYEYKYEIIMNNMTHVEFSFVSSRPVLSYRILTIRYKHEVQNNQIFCTFTIDNKRESMIKAEITVQCNPNHHILIEVKTPIKHYKDILVQGSFDKKQISGMIQVEKKNMINLSGQHDNFQNMKLRLTTPLKTLQSLNVDTSGKLFDGSSNLILSFNDYDQIDGSLTFKYQDLSQMNVDTSLNVRIGDSEDNFKLQVEALDNDMKPFHFLAVVNKNQIKLDTHQETKKYTGELKHYMDLELDYPILGLESKGLNLKTNGNMDTMTGDIQLLSDSGKLVDATITYDGEKGTILVREPKQMEYTFTQKNFTESSENELFFNWDSDDLDSNIVIKSIIRDFSTAYKTDRTLRFTVQCPKQTFGLEHSIITDSNDLQTSAKFFWDDQPESHVGYHLVVKDLSNRRSDAYDGNLKIQLPTRVIGIHGATSYDLINGRIVESTLRWDLDNDDSKKIGVKAQLIKQDHTQAKFSLILPQDAEIASKLILNKGNTILEGETKISYSDDSRETLTLFSKVENNQEHGGFFYSEDKYNYSIQLGLSHPESRLDVKMVSHMGMDNERLTSSFGIDYLTSRRQMNNLVLFGEINKLRREINLYCTSPYKSVGFAGTIVSQNPLEIKAAATVDNAERMTAHLLVDPAEKKLHIDSTNYGEGLSFTAYYPNQTTFQLNINRNADSIAQQENAMIVHLVSPNVLQTTLDWTPGTLAEVRDMIYENIKRGTMETKEFVDDLAVNLKKEYVRKYKAILQSVSNIGEPKITFVRQEILLFEQELEHLKTKLQSGMEFCEVRIGDFVLNKELRRLQQNLNKYVETLDDVIRPLMDSYSHGLSIISQQLMEMKNVSMEDVYKSFLKTMSETETKLFKTHFWDVSGFMHKITLEEFDKFWKWMDEGIEKYLDPQPMIEKINERIEDIKNCKVSLFLAKLVKENSWLVSKIRSALIQLKEDINNHPFTLEVVETTEDSANQIYQQAAWAYNYWQLEKVIPNYADQLLNLTIEVIEEEMVENMESLLALVRNPITHTDFENGVIVAKFPLPISLERLDKLPSPHIVSENVSRYMDKFAIWKSFAQDENMEVVISDFDNFEGPDVSYNSF